MWNTRADLLPSLSLPPYCLAEPARTRWPPWLASTPAAHPAPVTHLSATTHPSWHLSSTSSSLPSSTSYRTGTLPTLTPVRACRRWHIVCGKPHRPRPPCSSMCYCLARVAFMIYLDRIRWPTIFDVVLPSQRRPPSHHGSSRN